MCPGFAATKIVVFCLDEIMKLREEERRVVIKAVAQLQAENGSLFVRRSLSRKSMIKFRNQAEDCLRSEMSWFLFFLLIKLDKHVFCSRRLQFPHYETLSCSSTLPLKNSRVLIFWCESAEVCRARAHLKNSGNTQSALSCA